MLIRAARRKFNSKAILTTICSLALIKIADCLGVDHCYSDIGCFPLSAEFYHPRHRPINVAPWHRNRIKIKFELYSRAHPEGYMLEPWNRPNLIASKFDPKLETKIIIPGWLDNIKRAVWVKRLKDSLLWLWKPVNIIVVYWRNFTPYTIATANTRVVGAQLANLLQFIEFELDYDRAYHHLIGHSLGAHIAGYCGDRLPGLGRITALDPARPFFQHMPKSVRLDRRDAKFVDAIHSDFTPENAIFLIMSFGMTTPVGHVDFYPNGPPLLQAGCLRDTILSIRNGIRRGFEHNSLSVAFLESVRYLTACDHQRSHEWFIESITNRHCVFVGVRCNEFEGLINGRCTCDQSRSACAIMGIHADQMYLNDAHEDLWPLGSGTQRANATHRRPPMRTPVSLLHPTESSVAPALPHQTHEQLGKPITREQIHSRLKFHADDLRRPEVYLMDQISSTDLEVEQLLDQLRAIEDQEFFDFLRDNLNQDHSVPVRLKARETLARPSIGRRQELNPNDDLGFGNLIFGGQTASRLPISIDQSTNNLAALQGHSKLMSDIDRDIEQWYEGTSRWYLKTNNRASYCVNQYQVLVYIGPLKTSTGKKNIRANLILSIIGTRGQLVNQRFKPRSANLDSFTMQPFFILLEGSYSLGNILSVAIGWEARIDPDPIQATISFQNNLLEEVQSYWPTYKAKHPWLSETLKYDYSKDWRSPVGDLPHDTGSELLSQIGIHLHGRRRKDSLRLIKSRDEMIATDDNSCDRTRSNGLDGGGRCSIRRSSVDELLKLSSSLTDGQPIMAELHNIGVHLDRKLEDTIVINQVVVSPLQANYGTKGFKTSKTFCPPHSSYKLSRDQTVRLSPSLVGRCGHMSPLNDNRHHKVRTIRVG